MFQMIVLVAHEKRGHAISQDGSGAKDWVGLVLQESVLTHAANVDKGVDDEHWNEPAMDEEQPREKEQGGCDQQEQQAEFKKDPAPSGGCSLAKTENRNGHNVGRITDNEPAPVHEELEPGPAGIIRIVIRIACLTEVMMML